MAQIICKNVTLGYAKEPVASGIDFSVEAGDYLCIIGENGSGKTTLMRTLLGLQQPLSGDVILGDGVSMKEIGYLPQQTAAQRDFPASVEEIVLSGCQGLRGSRSFYGKREKGLAAANMAKMQIADLAKASYRNLSGGQQQRVLLARALCATGKILLLDEPVAGLDPKVTRQMYEQIEALHREGITIIMISHDVTAALAYATHILYMGGEVFFGTKEEFEKQTWLPGLVHERREEA